MRILSVSFWIGALISLFMGFHKMYVYDNSEYYMEDNKNVYVGADAYNYIINGTYSTAFFVLFGVLLLAGIGVEILKAVLEQGEKKEETVGVTTEN